MAPPLDTEPSSSLTPTFFHLYDRLSVARLDLGFISGVHPARLGSLLSMHAANTGQWNVSFPMLAAKRSLVPISWSVVRLSGLRPTRFLARAETRTTHQTLIRAQANGASNSLLTHTVLYSSPTP